MLLTIYLIGIAPAFVAGLLLVAAAVRSNVFRMPWWGVLLAAAWIGALWPAALWGFFR
jgi:hypothetical protein